MLLRTDVMANKLSCIILWIGCAVSPRIAVAQGSIPPSSITTDTGDFAPGWKSFTRYSDPWWCLDAALHARERYTSSLLAKSLRQRLGSSPTDDTLPSDVHQIASACMAHLRLADVQAPDQSALFQLAILSGEDSLTQAILANRLAALHHVNQRDSVLLGALGLYLSAEPARLVMAESLVVKIDTMSGAEGAVTRARAHMALLRYWTRTFDANRTREEANTIVGLMQYEDPQQLQWHLGSIYLDAFSLAMQAMYAAEPDSQVALTQRIRQFLERPELQALLKSKRVHDPRAYVTGLSADSIISMYAWGAWRYPTSERAVFPHADFRFPVPGQDSALRPATAVSLVIQADCGLSAPYLSSLFAGCGPVVHYIRQWEEQYGAKNLAVTVVAVIGGHVLRDAPEPAEQRAEKVRWYFQNFLQLPVAVDVDTASVTMRMPAPDGRILRGPPQDPWPSRNGGHLMLADADGRLLYQSNGLWSGNRSIAPFLDVLIRRVIGPKTQAGGMPSASQNASPSTHAGL